MKQFYPLFFCIVSFFISCDNNRLIKQDNFSIQELHEKARKYYDVKQLDSMIMVADQMLNLLKNDTLSAYRGHALIHKGTVYDLQGKYDSAAHYHYEALGFAEKINDKPLLSRALNNLGILHFSLRQSETAILHYRRYLSISRETGDSAQVCKALNNIGNVYATVEHDLEKAIPYFEECIHVAEVIGDDDAYATAKLTLTQIQSERNEFEKALLNVREIRDRGINHYYVDYTEAHIYMRSGEYDKAIDLFKSILQLKLDTRELVLAILNDLSLIYKEKGDLSMALEYKDKYQADRDSMHKIETHGTIESLKIAYETEKKEVMIASLEKEKFLFLWLGIAGIIVLLLLLMILLFRQRFIRQEKKLAEQRISELEKEKQLIATQSVLEGETTERSRLARDLHDGLGSMLTGVKMKLESIKHETELDNTRLEHFDNAFEMLNDSMTELRRVAHHLMPDSLGRYGLKVALSDFCNSFPSIQFDYFGSEDRLDSEMEVMIYRIIHELVNNALKHSGASQIMVQVMRDTEYIGVIVRDNGKGFDIAAQTKGMGLRNISDRVASYNGRIDIISKEGEGTEINIEFSIKIDN